MGLEIIVSFEKPPLQSEVLEELSAVQGVQDNGDRGVRWENEDIEGFFTIDFVEPAKQKKKKPKVAGLEIKVPWGGPTEEVTLVVQILDLLADKFPLEATTPLIDGPLTAGSFSQIEQAWQRANLEALVGYANTDDASIRARQERHINDDPARIEIFDAHVMGIESDQREAYRNNCALRVAQAFQRCGEHRLAIVTAHKVLERNPKEAFAMILLGLSFSALQDNETALTVFKRVLEVQPSGSNADYAQNMIDSLGG